MTDKNAIFILCGNCRTFESCFDSCYEQIISKLFPAEYNIYIFFYLKLTDPGPKGQDGWNFIYENVQYNDILKKLESIKNIYPMLHIEYKILLNDEIPDNDMSLKIKDRTKYISYFLSDKMLTRAMQCHYNFTVCGKYIINIEQEYNIIFDYIIYIRPDLYFTEKCKNIDEYNNNVITLGIGPNSYNNDHIAIIPRKYLNSFMFDRFNIYINNNIKYYSTAEEIYWDTICFEIKEIGNYYIKRK